MAGCAANLAMRTFTVCKMQPSRVAIFGKRGPGRAGPGQRRPQVLPTKNEHNLKYLSLPTRTPHARTSDSLDYEETLFEEEFSLSVKPQPTNGGAAEEPAVTPLQTRSDDAAVTQRKGPGTWRTFLRDSIGGMDNRVKGIILLNIMTLLMGSNWVVVKQSGASFDPFVFAALRFSLAAGGLLPFIAKPSPHFSKVVRAGLEVGMWSALGYLTQAVALQETDASRASLLSTFTVLAVPVFAGLSGQQIKPLVWASAIGALVGTAMLEQGGSPPNGGDALSIVSAIFFGLQIFRTEYWSRQIPKDLSLQLLGVSVATVAVICTSGALISHYQDIINYWDRVSQLYTTIREAHVPLGELCYTAWCSTDLVLFIEILALQDVTSTEAAVIYSMEPISGALFAYAFLGERLGALGIAGAVVILLASLATQFNGAVEETD